MSAVLQEIMSLLVGGITTLAQGLGNGIKALVEAIFLTGEGTSASPYALSTFGGVIVIFASVALAVGLSRWIMSFVTSFGRN